MADSSSSDQNYLAALINMFSGQLQGVGQAGMTQANMASNAALQAANASQNQFNQQQTQAQAGLNATQSDPFVKAKGEQAQATRAAQMGNIVNGRFQVPQNNAAVNAAFSPANQLASEQNFYQNVANTSPNSPTPDLSGLYGAAGANATNAINQTATTAQGRLTSEQAAVNAALQAAANPGTDSGAGTKTALALSALAVPIVPKVISALNSPSAASGVVPAGAPGAPASTAAPASGPGGINPLAGGGPSGNGNGNVPLAPNGVGPNGQTISGADAIQQWLAQGGGTGQSDFNHDGTNGSASTTGFFHNGGLVRGPKGIDMVPAHLTAGEGVITAPAMQQLGGARMLQRLNNGTSAFDRFKTTPWNRYKGRP